MAGIQINSELQETTEAGVKASKNASRPPNYLIVIRLLFGCGVQLFYAFGGFVLHTDILAN